jgi:dTDP-4-dehydrorhamnose 3,5-epimerase
MATSTTAFTAAVKDRQSVTAEGQSTGQLIEGVSVTRLSPREDERGEVCEIYNPAWGVHPAPLVYVYQATLRRGQIRGWVVHREQDDRLFINFGSVRIALYDDRDSPTYRLLNVFTVTERNRALVVIPSFVFHALQNVGETEAAFVNMPTKPYDHVNPDKYRLPLKNDLIPFSFDDGESETWLRQQLR